MKPAPGARPEAARGMIPPRTWIRWLVLIGALALILRGICLSELRDSPLLSVLLGDAQQYDAWAMRLAAGDWLGNEVFYQSPLYPYLLGVVYATVGHSVTTVRVLQILLGAASCVLLAMAVRRFAGARAGVAAGLLLAMYLMNIVAELQADLAWVADFGWFKYLTVTELIDSGAVPWTSIAVFGAVALGGWIASLVVFARRDLLA